MPAMTATFLRTLVEQSQRIARGVVPSVSADVKRQAGISPVTKDEEEPHFEPIAAVYSRAALAVADECLRSGERKLESFIHALLAKDLVHIRPAEAKDARFFENWNTPADIP
jgi:molybdopterin-guanine dinucleotide biosynthesis protein A